MLAEPSAFRSDHVHLSADADRWWLCLDEQGGERGLGVGGESRLEGPAAGFPLDHRVQRVPLADAAGLGLPGLLGAVAEDEHHTGGLDAQGPHEVRRVLHREVRPVVAVREDEAAVVRVARDPRVQRCLEAGVLDEAPLVPEATLRVEVLSRERPSGAGKRKNSGWSPGRTDCPRSPLPPQETRRKGALTALGAEPKSQTFKIF
jgi:hypothetical protein